MYCQYSTGQTRKIKPRTRYSYADKYALGYSSSSSSSARSYRILRYWYYPNDQKVWVAECEIYDLSSDSWRVLHSFPREHYMYSSGISLKGDTYWLAGDEREEPHFFLMKFDFRTERFVHLPLPFQSFNFVDDMVLSVVRDEKLSLLHIDSRSDHVMRICVTNKIDYEDANKDFSWRSDLVLKVDFAKFNLSVDVESFLLDEENKVAVLCCNKSTSDGDRTMVYIVGEDMYKQVYEDTRNASPINCPLLLTYVPSLVCIH